MKSNRTYRSDAENGNDLKLNVCFARKKRGQKSISKTKATADTCENLLANGKEAKLPLVRLLVVSVPLLFHTELWNPKVLCRDKFGMALRRSRATCVCVCETRKLYFGLNTYYSVPKNTECVFFSRFSAKSATFHPEPWRRLRLPNAEFSTLLSMLAAATQLFTDCLRISWDATHTHTHRLTSTWIKTDAEKFNWIENCNFGFCVARSSPTPPQTPQQQQHRTVESSGNYCKYFILLVGRRAFLLNSSFACISINTI